MARCCRYRGAGEGLDGGVERGEWEAVVNCPCTWRRAWVACGAGQSEQDAGVADRPTGAGLGKADTAAARCSSRGLMLAKSATYRWHHRSGVGVGGRGRW